MKRGGPGDPAGFIVSLRISHLSICNLGQIFNFSLIFNLRTEKYTHQHIIG